MSKTKVNWKEYLFKAVSKFQDKHPNGLNQLTHTTPENVFDLGKNIINLYSEATMAIIEPEEYTEDFEVDLEDYNEKLESNDLTFVKNVLREGKFNDKWDHVINLIEEIGY